MPVSTNENFFYEVVDDIAVITLQKDAFAMVTDITANRVYRETLEEIDETKSIKGLVQVNDANFDDVSAFEAFLGNLKGHAQQPQTQLSDLLEKYGNLSTNLMSQLITFSKPLVAGFRGSFVLEQLGLTWPFDLRIAANDSRATLPNVKNGFPPTGTLGFFLGQHLGFGRAFEILITETDFSAKRLYELGLVTEVVEKEQLLLNCRHWAERLSDVHHLGLRATRQLMRPDVDNWQVFVENARDIYKTTLAAHLKEKA